jgi:HEPN domain-containing protein
MTKANGSINNWIKSSNYDIKTGEHMLKAGRYIYVLFMCHLSVEKLLKALYEAVLAKVPPKTHNLIYLSNAVNLEIPEDHLKVLESLNDLSIPTRYPKILTVLSRHLKEKERRSILRKREDF